MYIFLGILAFIVILITIILLLPVYIIIKTDENDEVIIRYKILWKTFGEDPDPNQPIIKVLKQTLGVTRLDKKNFQNNSEKIGMLENFKDSFSLIIGLLKRLLQLLKYCSVKTLHIDIICADEDAAQTAMNYGMCYAVVCPLLGLLRSVIKVRPRGEKINISCDYEAKESYYSFDVVICVKVVRIIVAIFRAAFDEAKRISQAQESTSNKTQK